MKQLKSNARDLRTIFETDLTVAHISELLISHDAFEPAKIVKQEMLERDFDTAGLRVDGTVVGYLQRDELAGGTCGDYKRDFTAADDLIADSTPLIDLLPLLGNKPRYFVLTGNRVERIVTRGDLQKAPVRMLIFSVVTLVEMNLLRTIRQHVPDDSWQKFLSKKRLEKAKKLLEERKTRNEALDLADCLQLADKFDIVRQNKEQLPNLGFSATKLKDLKKRAEELRNRLAHGNDLVTGSSWEKVINTAADLEALLVQLEKQANG